MNLIDYTTKWVNGEILQGKIMFLIGALLLVGAIGIFRSDNDLLKGTLIPVGFMLLIFFGYGGFQTFGRPSHIKKVAEVYKEAPAKAIEQEYVKAQKDDKSYRTLKIVWVILIVISAILFLIFSTTYLKGLSIGLIALFLTTLIVDSVLHQRLLVYLEYLKGLSQ